MRRNQTARVSSTKRAARVEIDAEIGRVVDRRQIDSYGARGFDRDGIVVRRDYDSRAGHGEIRHPACPRVLGAGVQVYARQGRLVLLHKRHYRVPSVCERRRIITITIIIITL